jgi:signal transduction histidine kinase
MLSRILRAIDWFIPAHIGREPSDLSLARNFVFTHLMGPALGQSIAAFLYFADPSPGPVYWTIEASICLFWVLPFALKILGDLQLAAYVSVQNLTFVALFGSFFYGGVSSPFLPWLLVSLLLGFFYFARRPRLVLAGLITQLAVFLACYAFSGGFPERVPISDLAAVALISALSATIYMWWMAVYYAHVITQQSAIELEAERHRETADRLLRAMEKAQKANRAKSIFLAKMSHELRTPLNAVIGYSALLLEEVEAARGQPELITDLNQIHAAGRQLLKLVDEVLDLGRIESSTVELYSERFDLSSFIDDVLITARPLTAANGNVLEVQRDPALGEVRTDATKLRQSLLNLLGNAAKFTKNGRVTLSARRDRNPAGDWIRLQVRDTGIGIAKSDIARLFQDFEQATTSIGKDFGGTGLGLAISQRFCALMGGTISVESEPGKGSVFTIHIPAELVANDSAALPVLADAAEANRMVA